MVREGRKKKRVNEEVNKRKEKNKLWRNIYPFYLPWTWLWSEGVCLSLFELFRRCSDRFPFSSSPRCLSAHISSHLKWTSNSDRVTRPSVDTSTKRTSSKDALAFIQMPLPFCSSFNNHLPSWLSLLCFYLFLLHLILVRFSFFFKLSSPSPPD